jgi:phosphohistidine phosphatase
MKTLFLLRHAKSSWDNPDLTDFERPLNERGLRAAPQMGHYIKKQNIKPDVVISSPAVRARDTAELIIKSAGLKVELRFDARIYDATWLDLLRVIASIEDEKETAMLIGHNPGFEETVFRLTDEQIKLPTAALAKINLEIERWNETREFCGKVEWVVRSKDL